MKIKDKDNFEKSIFYIQFSKVIDTIERKEINF